LHLLKECTAHRDWQTTNTAYCGECDLGDLFGQEGAPQTEQSLLKTSKNTGVHWLSVASSMI